MTTAPKRRGRPRSQASREAILRAAAELAAPGRLSGLTMEGIARRAGVGKQTVYRWWPTRVDVVVEAIVAGHLAAPLPVPEDTGDLHRDLTVWLQGVRGEVEDGGASALSQVLVGSLAVRGQDGDAGRGRDAVRGVLLDPLTRALTARLRSAGPEEDHVASAADGLAATVLVHVLLGSSPSDVEIERLVRGAVADAPTVDGGPGGA